MPLYDRCNEPAPVLLYFVVTAIQTVTILIKASLSSLKNGPLSGLMSESAMNLVNASLNSNGSHKFHKCLMTRPAVVAPLSV